MLAFPLTFLAMFYIVPLVSVVAVSLMPGGKAGISAYLALFESGTFLSIVLRTLRLGLEVAALSLIIGYPYAYLLNKASGMVRQLLLIAVMMPFFTSVLIRSYAWVAILGQKGVVNRTLMGLGLIDTPLALVYNEVGALIGMTQVQLPLMILTLYGSMRRIDPQLLRAAEGLGAHRLISLFRIFLPLSMPGIAAGFGLVFTSTLGFYVTPALLGGASEYMVTQSIYVQLNNLNDFSGAAAQATVLLFIVVGLLILLRNIVGSNDSQPRQTRLGRFAPTGGLPERILINHEGLGNVLYFVLRHLGYLVCACAVVFLMITMTVVIPLGFSADAYLRFPPTGYSTRWISTYLGDRDWLMSTWFSLWISILGAAVATFFASIAAFSMITVERARLRQGLELLFVSPMIVPQFVVALALYFMFIKAGLVGSSIPYVICYGVFAFPYVFLVIHAAFQRFDISVIQAAANLGAKTTAIWRKVVIPILLPSFVSAAGFAFLTAFDDLVVALFFSNAGKYTLPMRMWADIKNEISPQIAAVAVVFFAAAIAFIGAVKLASVVPGVIRKAGPRTSKVPPTIVGPVKFEDGANLSLGERNAV
jgi:putative spermidine/putrescine transport system permease protein